VRTDDLIALLSADATPRRSNAAALVMALACASAIAVGSLVAVLGVRADFVAALGTGRFAWKFVLTLTLLATAFVAVRRLARPEAPPRWILPVLLAAPLLMLAGVVAELSVVPPDLWAVRAMGSNARVCLALVPALAALPLVAMLAGLRHGAPTRPTLAGAVAGLVAGALAATAYAAYCADDSPLFVALWYSIAIAMVATVGAIASRTLVRW
jgi:hypothetical protein